METLSENLLDEECRSSKTLSDYWDKNIIYVIWATLLQSFSLFVVTLSSTEHSTWSNIIAVFQSFGCDTFFNGAFNLERPFTTCSERLRNIYPSNVYQSQETLFDKLDAFGVNYKPQKETFQKLSNLRFWIDLCSRRKPSNIQKQQRG